MAHAGEAPQAPAALVEAIDAYLIAHPEAAVLEDGAVLFDLRMARYSVAESHGRCILQLWSEERNLVRTVVGVEHRAGCLRVLTRRMGAARPVALEVVPSSDRRTPTAREAGRMAYLRLLERVLGRRFPDWKAGAFRNATDLEHSFGPAYARGVLTRGPMAEAVLGVGPDESSSTIQGALTLGLLWLDYCREHLVAGQGPARNKHFGGMTLVVPLGYEAVLAERIAWLNHARASFRLLTLDPRTEELAEVEPPEMGNAASQLVHAFDHEAALKRAEPGIERVMELVPGGAEERIELRPRSASEVAMLLHGLEFARVRQHAIRSFSREVEVTFGAGANETTLTEQTEALCRMLLGRLFASRRPDGDGKDPLYRLQPERWLESRLRRGLPELLPTLRGEFLYTQVPAISSGDRGMLDLLTLDRAGRLAVIEVKAEEDLHLPLQGLDYWIRVRALNADRETQPDGRALGTFERQGYFAVNGQGSAVSAAPPRLLLVAPALRVHPANEAVLRYLSPQVDWELIAVGEDWRRDLRVIFRKRAGDA